MSSGPALLVQTQQGTTGGRPGQDPRGGPARHVMTRRGLLRLISPVAVVLLWQGVSALGIVSQQKLPPPSQVWSTAFSPMRLSPAMSASDRATAAPRPKPIATRSRETSIAPCSVP